MTFCQSNPSSEASSVFLNTHMLRSGICTKISLKWIASLAQHRPRVNSPGISALALTLCELSHGCPQFCSWLFNTANTWIHSMGRVLPTSHVWGTNWLEMPCWKGTIFYGVWKFKYCHAWWLSSQLHSKEGGASLPLELCQFKLAGHLR